VRRERRGGSVEALAGDGRGGGSDGSGRGAAARAPLGSTARDITGSNPSRSIRNQLFEVTYEVDPERLLEQAMVTSCRLENDSGDIECFKPFDEGAIAFKIVRDAEALAAGMDRHVESVFRNVDPDALCYR
jgi:hypothetical protein